MLQMKMPSRAVIQRGLAVIASVAVISWLRIRPIGIFFLVLFTFWFCKTRCNLRIVPPPEFEKKFEHLIERLRYYRTNKPTIFCAVATTCLFAVAIMGHLISGSMFISMGFVIAAIASTKYNFKLVKIQPKYTEWPDHDAELDREFMPEVNESNLFVLERASNLATISSPIEDADGQADEEEQSDEIPSELLLPDPIPEMHENSTDEDDHNDDDDDDDNNLPYKRTKDSDVDMKLLTETLNTTDDVMEFKKGHFKNDSSLSTTSSSSEESLSKGLKFPDHTTVDGPAIKTSASTSSSRTTPHNQEAANIVALAMKTQTQALLANGAKLLPSLVTDIVQWSMGGGGATSGASGSSGSVVGGGNINSATLSNSNVNAADTLIAQRRLVTALDSSDESDFEILENEDFK